LYTRGDGLLEEEESLEEIHKIREKLSKMGKKEKERLLKEIKERYSDLSSIKIFPNKNKN
jgi:hypothetical protein